MVTFHLVLLAWVFFRAADVGVALAVIGKICAAPATEPFVRPAMRLTCLMGLLLLYEWAQRRQPHAMQVQWWWPTARWAFYYGLVGAILLACQLNYTPFIYFQF
ncbi:MAG: hypothetical protein E6K60_13090 [Nitrospirae bacterium]|nr:MAG: hypothetical protein E6K60_13090 [Nitrospirota bacterium]